MAACICAPAPQLRGMNTTQPSSPKADLAVTQRLAQLLERLERSRGPVGAEQYRSVVLHLVQEFGDVPPHPALGTLLDSYPAAAELYENLHYQEAGLCRSGLEAATRAELQARDVIARVRRHPPQPRSADGQE